MFLEHSPAQVLRKHWRLVFFAGVILAILSFAILLVTPLEYRADAQILIISKSRYGIDPYTAVKSAERVGENLVQVVPTSDFYNKTMLQGSYKIDKTSFTNVSEKVRRKNWEKAVNASVIYGSGVINVSAYHKDKNNALALAGAAASALVGNGWEYVGGDVDFKIVNEPVVTDYPVRPNLPMNALAGFIIGAVLMSAVVLRKSVV
ncbi:MAG: hypothetical protein US42_C0016G0021 [Candidatus Magasanikbacteria bacterium GW2011_GWC2_37_14]|uniref:Polysaccharide chain length determinant N-terminal domain-containing protein n=1 Tax=Candidatus Magasanikbacteria bacterium GW2011_GWC2_37_14 TaxID=1619046 RepID=A0A0G0JFV0_9BACT|nr:MAG: hypothetical protein US42_C0016G0021 [Candidatus Magasanikbacteria bacterium GW2011_GWC2_37_14]